MNVWNGLEAYPLGAGPAVGSIGNYDGVHLGHREILRRVVEDARPRKARALLVTFDPHPAAIVAPESPPRLIDTRRQKLDRLGDCGLDDLWIVRFDPKLAAVDGEAFIELLFRHGADLVAVHVGENFRFGEARRGDLRLLEAIGQRRGFAVSGVPPVELDGRVISSSAIRGALAEGEVERAAAMLGRPYELVGEVVAGDGRGRQLGCPTANLDTLNDRLLREGVYITETVARASRVASVTNVGRRPTVGGRDVVVETHLLEFEGDLYGERLAVRFLARLRDEQRFASVSDLADQLARDRAAAESFFSNRTLGKR